MKTRLVNPSTPVTWVAATLAILFCAVVAFRIGRLILLALWPYRNDLIVPIVGDILASSLFGALVVPALVWTDPARYGGRSHLIRFVTVTLATSLTLIPSQILSQQSNGIGLGVFWLLGLGCLTGVRLAMPLGHGWGAAVRALAFAVITSASFFVARGGIFIALLMSMPFQN